MPVTEKGINSKQNSSIMSLHQNQQLDQNVTTQILAVAKIELKKHQSPDDPDEKSEQVIEGQPGVPE